MWYNKRIKFRGVDIDSGEYVYAELGQVSAEINPDYLTFITEEGMYTVDEDSIAQLVGRDKDDNEVYEGDTMTNEDGNPFIVILKPQGCTFREKDGRRDYSSINFEMTGRNAINNFTVKK